MRWKKPRYVRSWLCVDGPGLARVVLAVIQVGRVQLCVRPVRAVLRPLALMRSADRVPTRSTSSTLPSQDGFSRSPVFDRSCITSRSPCQKGCLPRLKLRPAPAGDRFRHWRAAPSRALPPVEVCLGTTGRQFTPRSEHRRVGDRGRQRARRDRPDAGNGRQTLAGLVRPMPAMNAPLGGGDLALQ